MINPVALVTITESGVVYSTERGEISHVTHLAARELHSEYGFPEADRFPDTDEPVHYAMGFGENFFIQDSHISDVDLLDDA